MGERHCERCHHPESDHMKDSQGHVHCNGSKPAFQPNPAVTLTLDALCESFWLCSFRVQ
jgi:hypothetical protein